MKHDPDIKFHLPADAVLIDWYTKNKKEQLAIYVQPFNGKLFFHARICADYMNEPHDEGGVFRPTKRGLSFEASFLPIFYDVLGKSMSKAAALGSRPTAVSDKAAQP